MSLSRASIAFAVLLAAAHAQEVGSLAGTVVDLSGYEVRGAQLRLLGTNGEIPQALSGGKGEFRFPKIAPGTYSIEATGSGFARATAQSIKVTGGAETTVKIVMKVAILERCDPGPKTKSAPIPSSVAEIAGVVKGPWPPANDSDWNPAENVLITATGPMLLTETGPKSGGLAASTRTDKEGRFKLPIQEPGRYTIVAHQDGYTDFMVEDIVVKTGQRVTILPGLPLDVCLTWDGCAPHREFPPPFCLD
jgi:hypothetical protein